MKDILKSIFLLLIYTSAPLFGFSQYKVDCGNIELTIPEFKSDATYRKRFLVNMHVLKPIDQSDANLELRFYYGEITPIKTIVIKCIKDSVYAAKYTALITPGKKQLPTEGTNYKSLGYIDSINKSAIYKIEKYKPIPEISWQRFLSLMILDNHLFELPDQKELDKNEYLIPTTNENRVYPYSYIGFELYVNGRFRSFDQWKVSAYKNTNNLPVITYYKNITSLLNKLIAYNGKEIIR
ncbi:hypothetical protein HDC92_002951 [Pedobacter sp. AK017]|uniref:hypothetical protein n=1 Tax=Pedobacter sp. AK017 TaxID=2723073 RepID=UPI001607BD1B|nr:hypothetical protein [Pedobacter sp. AK017]MBB5439264.1 hypothetical protein [Pedobacter sp. AK017]